MLNALPKTAWPCLILGALLSSGCNATLETKSRGTGKRDGGGAADPLVSANRVKTLFPPAEHLVNFTTVQKVLVTGVCGKKVTSVSIEVPSLPKTVTPCENGVWSTFIDLSELPDGPLVITVVPFTVDATGTAESIRIDKHATVPILTLDTPDADLLVNAGNKAAVPLMGRCTHESGAVAAQVMDRVQVTKCKDGLWALSYDFSAIPDGRLALSLKHTDDFLNESFPLVKYLTKKTSRPIVAITQPAAGSFVNAANAAGVTFSGTCTENGGKVSLRANHMDSPATTICEAQSWQVTLNASTAPEGNVTFRVDHADALGNNAVTQSIGVTKDTLAPVPGSAGTITVGAVTETGFTASWGAATDGRDDAASLSYQLYVSTAGDIATAADAVARGVAAGPVAFGATSATAASLQPSTTYKLNVVVRDTAGNASAYGQATITTPNYLWIGARGQALEWSTLAPGHEPARAGLDASFFDARGVVTFNGSVFVTDSYGGRVIKFQEDTGRYVGWTGQVYGFSDMKGPGSCGSLLLGQFTPTWCQGGRAWWHAFYGSDVGADGKLYVSDRWTHAIYKIDPATGVILGWSGRVAETPTGGASGCAVTAVDAATPGWCTGGSPKGGNGDGMYMDPFHLHADATYLYVADHSNGRIARINVASGAFAGWIGGVDVSPTGGDAGCASATPGDVTPGWCLGGKARAGSGDGFLDHPAGITGDGTYLYVTDAYSFKMSRFRKDTGAFAGWVGQILATPSSGAAGCTTAAFNSPAPGWCFGGSVGRGPFTQVGAGFTELDGIAIDGMGNLYVGDGSSYALKRFNAATGEFTGWIGRVGTTPTGGDPGCSAAVPGSLTPGWCLGGTASAGTGGGMFGQSLGTASIGGIRVDGSGRLYVVNGAVGLVHKYDAASGAFLGSLGMSASPSPGWSLVGLPTTGQAAGQISQTNGMGADAARNLYVLENARILKFDADGKFAGWTGLASPFSPGEGGVCSHAVGMTPGWCTDGAPDFPHGIFDGSRALAVGHAYLYVATASKILRFARGTGAYAGWIGKIAGSPTSGTVPACNGAAVGSFTPGWCTDGSAATSTAGDGGVSEVSGLYIDAADTHLYVADTYAIKKYKADTGEFLGWTGRVGSSPSGGDGACVGTAIGSPTPGWCLGGGAAAGAGDGMFSFAVGITGNESGDLFVGDHYNHRIVKFDAATGRFKGWLGIVDLTPTGGDPGCTAAASEQMTPGWCLGGTSSYRGGWDVGTTFYPGSVVYSQNALFVRPTYAEMGITKFNATTGQYLGWRGMVQVTPSQGGSACTNLAPGDVTPTWCKGGGPRRGTAPGAYLDIAQLVVDADGNLYVADPQLGRVTRIVKP